MENDNNGKSNNNENESSLSGVANVFAKSGKLQRSPARNAVTSASANSSKAAAERKGHSAVLSHLFTPKSGGSAPRDAIAEIRGKIDELQEFVKDKHNVHLQIKQLVTSIRVAVTAAEREQKQLKARAETAENALSEAAKKETSEASETPRRPVLNPRSDKRKRDTPGEEEEKKKAKNDANEGPSQGEGNGWRTVVKKGPKPNEAKKEGERKEPRRERIKGDAIVIEAKANVTYAAILQKVRNAPELKELGEKVVRTRRTQKGEMLFELQKDPSVKSAAFKELVAKALGHEAGVRALSQETTVECRYLDEITTEEEVRNALKEQCDLDDETLVIKLRKAYGGTQTASIRLSAAVAPKLLKKGKIKVGWSVCAFKTVPRVAKQMERCFKCWCFGHQAHTCAGPDRSKLCRKCGESGHFASDCTKSPRCVLCKKEDENDHMTGGFKCPVYKKAKASDQ